MEKKSSDKKRFDLVKGLISIRSKLKSAHLVVNTLRLVTIFLYAYCLVIVSTMYLTPMITSTIGGNNGLSYESAFLDILVLLIFPAVFGCGLLFVATLYLIRAGVKRINKFYNKLINNDDSKSNETLKDNTNTEKANVATKTEAINFNHKSRRRNKKRNSNQLTNEKNSHIITDI